MQKKDTVLNVKYNEVIKYYNLNNFSSSLEKSLALLSELDTINKSEILYLTYFSIGNNFLKMKDHVKAIIYLKKALTVLIYDDILKEKSLYKNEKFDVNKNFFAKNLLRIGLEYYNISKNDSAIVYYEKVISINSFDNEILSTKASAFNNLSAIYIKENNYGLAKKFALKAVEIRRVNKDAVNEASALNNLGSIHLLEKDFIKAKQVYIKALDLIENHKTSYALKYREELYYNLAWALYNLEDFTAYDYQEKSYIIKDSLRNTEFEHIVQQVYEKYQLQIAEKEANKAESEVALEKAQERKTNWFLGAVMALILGISGSILYNYKLRQKNLKLRLEQTKSAQKSKLEKLKSESQVRILNATLDGKETERKQIAETLHDSVSSLLSSANFIFAS